MMSDVTPTSPQNVPRGTAPPPWPSAGANGVPQMLALHSSSAPGDAAAFGGAGPRQLGSAEASFQWRREGAPGSKGFPIFCFLVRHLHPRPAFEALVKAVSLPFRDRLGVRLGKQLVGAACKGTNLGWRSGRRLRMRGAHGGCVVNLLGGGLVDLPHPPSLTEACKAMQVCFCLVQDAVCIPQKCSLQRTFVVPSSALLLTNDGSCSDGNDNSNDQQQTQQFMCTHVTSLGTVVRLMANDRDGHICRS